MVYNSEQSSVNFLSENGKDIKISAMLTKKPNMRKIFCAFLLSIFFLTLFCFVCSSPCIAGEGHYKKIRSKVNKIDHGYSIPLQDGRLFFTSSATIYNPVTNEIVEGSPGLKNFGMEHAHLGARALGMYNDFTSYPETQLKNGNILYINTYWTNFFSIEDAVPSLILEEFGLYNVFIEKLELHYPSYRGLKYFTFDRQLKIIKDVYERERDPQDLKLFEQGLSIFRNSRYVYEYNIQTNKFIKKGALRSIGYDNSFRKLIPLSNGKVAICMPKTVEIYDPETGNLDLIELSLKPTSLEFISKTKDEKLVYVVRNIKYNNNNNKENTIFKIIYIDLENKKVQISNKEHIFGWYTDQSKAELDLGDGRYIFGLYIHKQTEINPWYDSRPKYKAVYLIDFNKDEIKYLGTLKLPRFRGSCVRLDDKKIMFVGGADSNWRYSKPVLNAEILDIETGESVITQKNNVSAFGPELYKLKDGRILIRTSGGLKLYVPKNWKKEK